MDQRTIRDKALRIVGNKPPRVLDLFSGCGGLSLGFLRAGYRITGAIEIDEKAALSHAKNFYRGNEDLVELHGKPRDITKLEPCEFANELKLGEIKGAIDVIIGGPPCQAYARVGRAKLREIRDHPEAFKVDPRADLYLRYLQYVEEFMPLAILMENVPDILNHGGRNVVQEMVETLKEMGYIARYSLINSAHYGVPQMRERVYMIAIREELETKVRFPKATHQHRLPSGYKGSRQVALKLVDSLFGSDGYLETQPGHDELPPAVTARDALEDLPRKMKHQEEKPKRGPRRFTELARYRTDIRPSRYAAMMREWDGFESEDGVYDHVLRDLPRDTEIFRHMKQGDEYPAAHRVATELFEIEATKRGLSIDGDEWRVLHRKMVPPYPVHSFPNRWWKLKENGPSRTLMAHIGKDTYSHIHHDGDQARVITPREAARLQSFPDGFIFEGPMNPAFKQIGNAVPPVMAHAIAKTIREDLLAGCTRLSGNILDAAE
jgi:DNA (cytosine-5)-methyltransferase 1